MRNDSNGNGNEQGLGGACDCINIGDVVEHIMNTGVFGVVIGFAGSLLAIRTSPSLATLWFHEWELQPVEDDEIDGGGSKADLPDNVVDFTKAAKLRADTKTEGAA